VEAAREHDLLRGVEQLLAPRLGGHPRGHRAIDVTDL
jgi:hypothetical protein